MQSIPVWGHAAIVLGTFFAIAVGAKYVVDSAAAVAERLGVSHLVIGLTVVAFGTSAPEFGVTLVAAFEGRDSISVGNIVGSNIFNLGFILGGAALVRAIPTDRILVWRDALTLIFATVVLYLLVGFDLHLGVVEGAVLFSLLLGYLVIVWRARKDGVEPAAEMEEVGSLPWHDSALAQTGFLVGGFIIVGLASHFLIESASALALHFGVSEWVIAVTVVAAGTSVPELATVLAGVARGHLAMSAGNVIGSDIFNVLGVLGLAGILQPMGLAPEARASLLALTGMVVVVAITMRTGWRVSRLEGLLLLVLAVLRWVLDFASRTG
jgi:cation:H+ antiporter